MQPTGRCIENVQKIHFKNLKFKLPNLVEILHAILTYKFQIYIYIYS